MTCDFMSILMRFQSRWEGANERQCADALEPRLWLERCLPPDLKPG